MNEADEAVWMLRQAQHDRSFDSPRNTIINTNGSRLTGQGNEATGGNFGRVKDVKEWRLWGFNPTPDFPAPTHWQRLPPRFFGRLADNYQFFLFNKDM
ncbi:MAG: hypothetical protein WKG07_43955 [Hymenobacter sp.]